MSQTKWGSESSDRGGAPGSIQSGGVKRRSETESAPQKPGEINTLSAAAEWCPCAGDWKEETTTKQIITRRLPVSALKDTCTQTGALWLT